MPIFEYLCDDCGTNFEKLVRRSDESASVACPSCGDSHVNQQISRFSAHGSSSKSAMGECSADESVSSCGSGMCGTPGFCGRN